MKRLLLTTLVLALIIGAMVHENTGTSKTHQGPSSASASVPSKVGHNTSDYLYWRWPRFTAGGKAEIAVSPDVTFDSRYLPGVQTAIANWNLSPYVHLTLIAPSDCKPLPQPYPHVLCLQTENNPESSYGGHSAILTDPLGQWVKEPYSHYITYSLAVINMPYIPTDGFWDVMIACHEIGEAMGLPDASDSPVTTNPQPTCLTRDYNYLTNTPGTQDYARLGQLYNYSGADIPYSPWCYGKRNRNTGKCTGK